MICFVTVNVRYLSVIQIVVCVKSFIYTSKIIVVVVTIEKVTIHFLWEV